MSFWLDCSAFLPYLEYLANLPGLLSLLQYNVIKVNILILSSNGLTDWLFSLSHSLSLSLDVHGWMDRQPLITQQQTCFVPAMCVAAAAALSQSLSSTGTSQKDSDRIGSSCLSESCRCCCLRLAVVGGF